jgi:hypothetical protein
VTTRRGLEVCFDPEDLREIIGAYHRAIAETVGRFAGFVAKYMGDGVLIYLGYPEAHEDDAERAAGLAILNAVGRLDTPEPLQVRLGIASGQWPRHRWRSDWRGGGAGARCCRGDAETRRCGYKHSPEPMASSVRRAPGTNSGGCSTSRTSARRPWPALPTRRAFWRVSGESGVVSRFEALRSDATLLIGPSFARPAARARTRAPMDRR